MHRRSALVNQHVGLAAIDIGARPTQPHVVRLVRRHRAVDEQLVSSAERGELVFSKQRHRDRGTLACSRVFYHHEAGCRDAPFGAPLDGEPLRREFDHVRSIRLPLEAALELGEHKGAIWGPVGAIDLGVKPEWPPGIENPLRELEACALELLRQPGLLTELQSLLTRDYPYANKEDRANGWPRARAWPSSRLPQRILGGGDDRSQRRLGEPPDTWVSRQVSCHRRRYPIVDARKRTAEGVATQDSVAQGSQGARLGGVFTPQLGGDEAPRFALRRAHVGVHHEGLAQESRMTAVTVANAFLLARG